MQRYRMYIGGQHVDPASGTWFETFNPYTGEPWAEIARGNADDVDRAVRAAYKAFTQGPWPELTASQRGLLIHRLGDLAAREAQRLAEIEVRDNGKLLTEMRAQFSYIPQWYYYFGGLADKIEGSVTPIDKKGYFNFTRHEPLGVVAAITPWNSPLLLATWKIAPALAAGCTIVLKPSEFTSASALEFAQSVRGSGLPSRRDQRRHRLRQRSGRTLGGASAGTENNVYRFGCRWPCHQRGSSEKLQARELGTRGQVAQYRVRRRQPRRRGERRHLGDLCSDGPDLHCRIAAAAAGDHPRCLPGQAAGTRPNRPHGRSHEPGHPGGSDHHAAAVREGPRLHQDRPE